MSKFILILAAWGLMVSFPFTSFPEELKVGYVNFVEVVNNYNKTIDYEKELEKKAGVEEKRLNAEKEIIERMQQKLSLLKQGEQEKERNNIIDAVKKYKKLEREIFMNLKKDSDAKKKEITDDIREIIKDYANRNGFDLIVDEAAVLYGKKTFDITSQILKLVNNNYKK